MKDGETEPMLIDIHSHLLPGIDDGAQTAEEAAQALRVAKRQGIEAMILTPHFYPDGRGATREKVLSGIAALEATAREAGVRLYPGMECFYHTKLPAQLESGQALTLAGSRYALVEFSEDIAFSGMLYALNSISESGFVPIVAHYERYRCLMNRTNLARLKREGYLLQINFDTLQRVYGVLRRNPFLRHLSEGVVDFLGSDTHGTHFRPLRIGPSVDWLRERKLLDGMNGRAEKILRDEY